MRRRHARRRHARWLPPGPVDTADIPGLLVSWSGSSSADWWYRHPMEWVRAADPGLVAHVADVRRCVVWHGPHAFPSRWTSRGAASGPMHDAPTPSPRMAGRQWGSPVETCGVALLAYDTWSGRQLSAASDAVAFAPQERRTLGVLVTRRHT